MLKSNYTKQTAVYNGFIELGENDGKGKGRYFQSRFIEAGVAYYENLGTVLITKETLNKFINTMVGCPVIINHKDVTDKNVDKLRVGTISRVWFNDLDGWFYCEGILTDNQAIDLIKNQGWSVSCSYNFVSDGQKKTYHGKEIDQEFTDGEFLHLAIVENPRYEGANIVVNSIGKVLNWLSADEIGGWITTKDGVKIPIRKGLSNREGVKEFAKTAKLEKAKKDKKRNEAFEVLASATGKESDYIKRHFHTQKVKDLIQEAKTGDKLKILPNFNELEYFNTSEFESDDIKTSEEWINYALDIIEGNAGSQTTEEQLAQYYEGLNDFYAEQEAVTKKKYDDVIEKYKKGGNIESAEKELAKAYGKDSIEDFGENDIDILTKFYSDIEDIEANKEFEKSFKETKTQKENEEKHNKINDLETQAYKEFKTVYENYIHDNDIEGWGHIKASDIDKIKKKFNKKYKEAFKKLDSDRFVSFEEFAKRVNKANNSIERKDNLIMTVLNDLENFVKGIIENACDKKEKEVIEEKEIENEEEKDEKETVETEKEDEKEEKFEEEKEIAENEDEDEKEEIKEDKKEDKKEVKNSMEHIKDMAMGGNTIVKNNGLYTSQADRLELGNKF